MDFKIKDLMIQVLPQDKMEFVACAFRTRFCRLPSLWCRFLTCQGITLIECRWLTDVCGPISPYCGISRCGLSEYQVTPGIREQIEQLVDPVNAGLIKEQLRQALKYVETAEGKIDEEFSPQTMEQVDLLEKNLKDAIGELAKRKTELTKRRNK